MIWCGFLKHMSKHIGYSPHRVQKMFSLQALQILHVEYLALSETKWNERNSKDGANLKFLSMPNLKITGQGFSHI
jgi:hypothetical protein